MVGLKSGRWRMRARETRAAGDAAFLQRHSDGLRGENVCSYGSLGGLKTARSGRKSADGFRGGGERAEPLLCRRLRLRYATRRFREELAAIRFSPTPTRRPHMRGRFHRAAAGNVTADRTIEREGYCPHRLKSRWRRKGCNKRTRIHKRGGASIPERQRWGYKLEFTRTTDGFQSLSGDSGHGDGQPGDSAAHERTGYDDDARPAELGALCALMRRDEPFSARKTQYCELFLNEGISRRLPDARTVFGQAGGWPRRAGA